MIFGCYPCCGGDLTLGVPDLSPQFQKETCPHCSSIVWHKLSRIDPESWIEAEFLALYDVDEEKKHIAPKNDPKRIVNPEIDALVLEYMNKSADIIAEDWANELLYGKSTVKSGLSSLLPNR